MFLSLIGKRYPLQCALTTTLLLFETGMGLLFPLLIGKAIDGILHENMLPLLHLGVLGILSLITGWGRRVYDSRFYSKIYLHYSNTVIANLSDRTTSIKSARLAMLREWVDFLENGLPELVTALVSLLGTLILLASLHLYIFYGGLATLLLIGTLYLMTSSKTLRITQSAHDEWEKQVSILEQNHPPLLANHLRKMMKWNIQLSDLEAVNYTLSWIILLSFLIVVLYVSGQNKHAEYGALLAIIMYVFQWIENLIQLPYYYQNGLRLKEMMRRIEGIDQETKND